jgi:hypothetical protein
MVNVLKKSATPIDPLSLKQQIPTKRIALKLLRMGKRITQQCIFKGWKQEHFTRTSNKKDMH